jgi:predicted nucleotide-binding protein
VRAQLTRFKRNPKLLNLAVQREPSDSIMINRISNEAMASRKIFVVHGHGKREHEIARYLEHLKFNPIILHEQANQGRTVIEKFESHSDVGFAVVLLTPDDLGRAAEAPADQMKYRARQNVILELGYFIGRLGRDRVCALMEGEVELPSDIVGVLWEPLDSSGAWKQRLVHELKAARYDVA